MKRVIMLNLVMVYCLVLDVVNTQNYMILKKDVIVKEWRS